MSILENLKVMYVEDNYNTRYSIERFLKRGFGKVFLAENAEKGIQLFHEKEPDIAIVDILLPGMGGLEMIKKIRETNSTCRFLITSSVSDVATILKAVDLDIANYIVKPIDTDDFEEKLTRIGQSIMEEKTASEPAPTFDLTHKKETEEEIRKAFIKILKEKSGKGPRDAAVFISRDTIEISVYGVLSLSEKVLLKNIKNIGHVEETHRLFYHAIEKEITDMIKDLTGTPVELGTIKVNAFKDREVARFRILRY